MWPFKRKPIAREHVGPDKLPTIRIHARINSKTEYPACKTSGPRFYIRLQVEDHEHNIEVPREAFESLKPGDLYLVVQQ